MVIKIQFADLNQVHFVKELSTTADMLSNTAADLWTEGKAKAVRQGADQESLGVTAWVDNVRVVPAALLSGRIASYK